MSFSAEPHTVSPALTDGLHKFEAAGRPVFFWSGDGQGLAWANPAAASFTQTGSVSELVNSSFGGTSFAAQMDMISRRMVAGAPRLELLRMPVRGRVLSFVGRVSVARNGDETGLLIVGPETPMTAPLPAPLPVALESAPSTDAAKSQPRKKSKDAAAPAVSQGEAKSAPKKRTATARPKKDVIKTETRSVSKPPAPVKRSAPKPATAKAVSAGRLEPHERESLAAIARMLNSETLENDSEVEMPSVSSVTDIAEIARLQAETARLEAALEALKKQDEHKSALHQKQIEALTTDLGTLKAERDAANAIHISKHNVERAALQAELSALKQTYAMEDAEQSKTLSDAERLRNENEILRGELEDLRKARDETLYVLKENETQAQDLQAELHKARVLAAELQTVLDTATDGIVILDGEAHILSMNTPAETLFGEDISGLEGENLLDLLDASSQEPALHLLQAFKDNPLERAGGRGVEVIGVTRQGSKVPLYMTLGSLGQGDVPGSMYCAVLRDISKWKLAEIELQAARQRAEKASDLKSDFLAKISHEIRTPLNAIIGFSEVMLEERFGEIGSERYKQYLSDIHTSGEHLLSLVNDLLDLSKIEAGKLDLVFAPVYLNDLVLQTIALLQPQANRNGVILRSSLAATPPIVADQRSLRQIMLNLLSNAVRFTSSGGQIILSTLTDESGQVILRVRDTGIGMSEQEIRQAMEPFRQIRSDNHKPERDGTGLGLPISKALADANHASFTIESTPGEGTLISLVFAPGRVLSEQF